MIRDNARLALRGAEIKAVRAPWRVIRCERRIWVLLGPLVPELLLMKSQPFKAGDKEKQFVWTWKITASLLLFHVSCLFVLTQLPSWVTTQEFRVFGPSDPIVAAPGGEAILPCSVFPAMNMENMEELRWFRSSFSEAVLVYRDQEEQKREQMPDYSWRTSLVKDQFQQGTAALRIQNVQASDSGIYICHFKQGHFHEEAILELKVAAMGSVPEVYIKGPEDSGVCVVCMTSGWYPKPQVHWRDSRGANLTASSEIHHEDAQGLFSIETSLVVKESSVRNVTCSTFNPILGQEKAMSMFLPEPFFPQASLWKPAFFVTVTMMGLLILGTSYLLSRGCSARLTMQEIMGNLQHEKDELQKTKEDALRTTNTLWKELDIRKAAYMAAWRKAQLYADWRKEYFQAWSFTLDPASAQSTLAISQDRLSVTRKDSSMHLYDFSSVLGIRGISCGRHYWEVKLKHREGSEWILGVCREVVDRKDISFETPHKGFWTVGQSSRGYWAYVDSGRDSLSVRKALKHAGVFVDYTEGDISFYNMSDMSHMFSFHEASLSGTLFPYFRLRSGNVSMMINSMPCASEGREGEQEEEGEEQGEGKEGDESSFLQQAGTLCSHSVDHCLSRQCGSLYECRSHRPKPPGLLEGPGALTTALQSDSEAVAVTVVAARKCFVSGGIKQAALSSEKAFSCWY
ncbi:LOW QUALITY PROTEIN: butyrophilin subfamily 3 member A1-like [Mus pahari]|uniref:LOW QUALITY PROTEIN: butyrophilin subfamily 3 member A1-like n=1 Tax=Mus pahari TaxID=10093 RepID=UPI001114E883|nr:LOW QUALITY PROTEIN: butyrophilin subfamily 3 member A1-like [Mus pahari]